MSRGEALSNGHLLAEASSFVDQMTARATVRGLTIKFNLSTIMPNDFNGDLIESFSGLPITFYYSIYSMSPDFRKRWMPKSRPVIESLNMLKAWQDHSSMDVVMHWAFIEGENDSEECVNQICDAILEQGLSVKVNLVRYNPPNNKSRESSMEIIERNLAVISERIEGRIKIVPRVGRTCFASCGMFVSD